MSLIQRIVTQLCAKLSWRLDSTIYRDGRPQAAQLSGILLFFREIGISADIDRWLSGSPAIRLSEHQSESEDMPRDRMEGQ
jgi:hypothetical protein